MALRQAKYTRRSRVCTSALLDSVAILSKRAVSCPSCPSCHVSAVHISHDKKSAAAAGMQMVHVAVEITYVSTPSLPLLVLF